MTDDGSPSTIRDSAAPTHAEGQRRTLSSNARISEDRYMLRALLGSGGMGEVWLAHDVRIDREIAIKMMRGEPTPDAVARFLREARVQGRLEHPSVVPVHDFGPAEQAPYFAMKRITGTTLHDVIVGEDPEWTRRKLLARFVEVGLAIEFAHRHGVIHRDLKPANIMLGEFGETYVLDWGLARIVDTQRLSIQAIDLRAETASDGLTVAGAVLGTPGYMAPEQLRGEPIDARVDVFALGCILFEILAREPAIARDKPIEATLRGGPFHPAQRRPDLEIAPELDALTARAMAGDPGQRPTSARELADAVQAFLDGDRDLERRRQLSATHTANAKRALERSGEAARVDAMREAGRAIALDPENASAQRLVVKLMLEVPDPIPAAAQARIVADNDAITRTVLRLGMRAYLANAVFIPFVKLLGVAGMWPFLVLGALAVMQGAVCWFSSRRRGHPLTAVTWTFLIVNHIAMLALVGVFFGTLPLVPILVFESMPVMLLLPHLTRPLLALLVHLACIGVPLALELLGIIPRSFRIEGDALVLRPWALEISPQIMLVLTLVVVVFQMYVITRVLGGQRASQERAQRIIHAQRWQLEQMVQGE